MLSKRQRNAVFATMLTNGLAPESCALQDPASRAVTVASIRHEASGSSFTLWPDHDEAGKFGGSTSVGSADFGRCSAYDWDQILDKLASWAREVRYEIDAPDLWAELQQVPAVLAAAQSAETSNAPFTLSEQTEISGRLDEIKKLMREKFELTPEQLSAIKQTLDDVKEASTRLGRKDWLMMFFGATVSVVFTDAVPPAVIRTVLMTVVHGIAHLFGLGLPPSMITT